MRIDTAVEEGLEEPAVAPSYADTMSLADDSVADSVSEQIRSTMGSSVNDEDLRPKVGLSWLSWKEADAFVRLAGARTAPYRMMPGGQVTSRRYCCRSRGRSVKQVIVGDAEDAEEGEDAEGRGCGCAAQVVMQHCTVKQLINGSVRK